MTTIKYSIDDKTEISEEQIKKLEGAKDMPIVFDDDSPEVTSEMIKRAYRPGASPKQ